jgi:hypothetical protein
LGRYGRGGDGKKKIHDAMQLWDILGLEYSLTYGIRVRLRSHLPVALSRFSEVVTSCYACDPLQILAEFRPLHVSMSQHSEWVRDWNEIYGRERSNPEGRCRYQPRPASNVDPNGMKNAALSKIKYH